MPVRRLMFKLDYKNIHTLRLDYNHLVISTWLANFNSNINMVKSKAVNGIYIVEIGTLDYSNQTPDNPYYKIQYLVDQSFLYDFQINNITYNPMNKTNIDYIMSLINNEDYFPSLSKLLTSLEFMYDTKFSIDLTKCEDIVKYMKKYIPLSLNLENFTKIYGITLNEYLNYNCIKLFDKSIPEMPKLDKDIT